MDQSIRNYCVSNIDPLFSWIEHVLDVRIEFALAPQSVHLEIIVLGQQEHGRKQFAHTGHGMTQPHHFGIVILHQNDHLVDPTQIIPIVALAPVHAPELIAHLFQMAMRATGGAEEEHTGQCGVEHPQRELETDDNVKYDQLDYPLGVLASVVQNAYGEQAYQSARHDHGGQDELVLLLLIAWLQDEAVYDPNGHQRPENGHDGAEGKKEEC